MAYPLLPHISAASSIGLAAPRPAFAALLDISSLYMDYASPTQVNLGYTIEAEEAPATDTAAQDTGCAAD